MVWRIHFLFAFYILIIIETQIYIGTKNHKCTVILVWMTTVRRFPWFPEQLQLMPNTNRRILSCLPQGLPLCVPILIVTVTARVPTPWFRFGSIT